MNVGITGASGFIGRPLTAYLDAIGHRVIPLPRLVNILPAVEAVIHLAGESVVGLWTPGKRRRIMASRVEGTRRLVAAITHAPTRPRVLLSASAVGYYGHRPGESLIESAGADPHDRFRAQVCSAWETEAQHAVALGCRVVPLRLGNVMAAHGGFLGGLLPTYRRTGVCVLGNPGASLSWIALDDAVRLIAFALENEALCGPINVVAPNAITQATLAKTLASHLGCRMRWRIPSAVLRLLLGEFSAALLDDQRVLPAAAKNAGFQFTKPAWRSCVEALKP